MTGFRLEKGVTGFRYGKEPPLPEVPVRAFRKGCFEAARIAGGTVEEITERVYPYNFHAAVIATPENRFAVVCNGVHPLIAFIVEGSGGVAHPVTFTDPPPWSSAFTDTGFLVMPLDLLDAPLDTADTTALGKGEWLQIQSWRPESIGQTVFNSWD